MGSKENVSNTEQKGKTATPTNKTLPRFKDYWCVGKQKLKENNFENHAKDPVDPNIQIPEDPQNTQMGHKKASQDDRHGNQLPLDPLDHSKDPKTLEQKSKPPHTSGENVKHDDIPRKPEQPDLEQVDFAYLARKLEKNEHNVTALMLRRDEDDKQQKELRQDLKDYKEENVELKKEIRELKAELTAQAEAHLKEKATLLAQVEDMRERALGVVRDVLNR